MPKPKPLTPEEAKRSLANRFGPRADRLRQLNTKYGMRPQRVFLVWTKFTGDERGEGRENEVRRVEILPTPLVTSLDAIALNPFTAGLIAMGSVKVSEISMACFTADMLRGRTSGKDIIPEPVSFFYEIVEDGRADAEPARQKYRPASQPVLVPGDLHWLITLERISEDRDREGKSRLGPDED